MSIEPDGLKECNDIQNAVEPLINVDELKKRWLFGIVPVVDEQGNVLSDETLQSFIDNAISLVEHDLDISLVPRTVVEQKDYHQNDYYEWGYFNLNNIPVIEGSVEMSVVYLYDDQNQPETVLDIPKNWIRLRAHDGQVRLIPNNRFPANLQIGSAGAFFPELFNRHGMVPHLWRIKYSYGFKDGKVPKLINAAVGMLASIMAMNVAGDLKIGSGIASLSLNLDGLSQSINSTASAENHTYSAKVQAYGNTLFGEPGGRNPGIIKILRDFYRGETLNLI